MCNSRSSTIGERLGVSISIFSQNAFQTYLGAAELASVAAILLRQ